VNISLSAHKWRCIFKRFVSDIYRAIPTAMLIYAP